MRMWTTYLPLMSFDKGRSQYFKHVTDFSASDSTTSCKVLWNRKLFACANSANGEGVCLYSMFSHPLGALSPFPVHGPHLTIGVVQVKVWWCRGRTFILWYRCSTSLFLILPAVQLLAHPWESAPAACFLLPHAQSNERCIAASQCILSDFGVNSMCEILAIECNESMLRVSFEVLMASPTTQFLFDIPSLTHVLHLASICFVHLSFASRKYWHPCPKFWWSR